MVPSAPEGGHGAPQSVGLAGGKAGGDNSDFHRLFLEQRHAQGFAQHRLQLGRRVGHVLLAVAAAQIRVDHVALDRTGTHDRHLDHQIVKAAWFHTRQERHLGPALDLKNP